MENSVNSIALPTLNIANIGMVSNDVNSVATKRFINSPEQKLFLVAGHANNLIPSNRPVLIEQGSSGNSLTSKGKIMIIGQGSSNTNNNEPLLTDLSSPVAPLDQSGSKVLTKTVIEPQLGAQMIAAESSTYAIQPNSINPTIVTPSNELATNQEMIVDTSSILTSSNTSTIMTTKVVRPTVASVPSTTATGTIHPTIQHGTFLKTASDSSKQAMTLKQTPMNHITQLQQIRPKTYLMNKGPTTSNSTLGAVNGGPAIRFFTGLSHTGGKPNFIGGTAVIRSNTGGKTIVATKKATSGAPATVVLPSPSSGIVSNTSCTVTNSVFDSGRKFISKALKPPRQLPPPQNKTVVDSLEVSDANDAEVAAITNGFLDNMKKEQKKKQTEEVVQQLFTDEKIDRSSPELWPEMIPGVSKFLSECANNFLSDSNTSIALNNEVGAGVGGEKKKTTTTNERRSEEAVEDINTSISTPKPISKTFRMTPYGLVVGSPSDECCSSTKKLRTVAGGEEKKLDGETTGIAFTTPGSAEKLVNVKPITSHGKEKKKQLGWQKDLDQEEIELLYAYGSLTASSLLDKVKDIQNLAYQLGLEEEREMMRAKYLNVFSEGGGYSRNRFFSDSLPDLAMDNELMELGLDDEKSQDSLEVTTTSKTKKPSLLPTAGVSV